MTENIQKEHNLDLLHLIVFVLTIYVLGAILVDTFFNLPLETSRVLNFIDDAICIFFLFEFFVRLYQAENKLQYLKWGWIDLVSSIPTFTYFRAGRALRLIRLLRIVRAFRTTQHFVQHIFRNRAQGAFVTVSVLAVLLVIFCSIGILQVEHEPNSNIKTAEDALWWSYVTITTVGYGDKFPVTTEGRFIGVILMTAGVGLFGTFSGFVASWFVSGHKREKE
jgi:voltage-gated potassium channel